MREMALATGVNNKEIIEFLNTAIKSKLDFCKTIVTNYSDNNFSYLLVACDEEFKQPCEAVLKDIIIEYIEEIYKINYLKTKIKNPITDNLGFNAYIKVLSLFDRATDETALKKIIMLNQTFFVDSFLEFRLVPLKHHWDNLAELSSDNLSMFSAGTFVDVIKFLMNTMESEVYKVKVVCKDENFSVYNIKSKNDKLKKIADCKTPTDLIGYVLNSCPNYVDVYINSEKNNEAVSFLSNIFTNRLKIYSKN